MKKKPRTKKATCKDWLKSLISDVAVATERINLELHGRCPYHIRRKKIEDLLIALKLDLHVCMHFSLDLSYVEIDELQDNARKIAKKEAAQ